MRFAGGVYFCSHGKTEAYWYYTVKPSVTGAAAIACRLRAVFFLGLLLFMEIPPSLWWVNHKPVLWVRVHDGSVKPYLYPYPQHTLPKTRMGFPTHDNHYCLGITIHCHGMLPRVARMCDGYHMFVANNSYCVSKVLDHSI